MAGAFGTLNFKIAKGNVRKTEWLCFEVEWLRQVAARPRDNPILWKNPGRNGIDWPVFGIQCPMLAANHRWIGFSEDDGKMMAPKPQFPTR